MAAMVQLRTSWEIKYQDDKWMSLPSTLVETFEGNAYLKIRPSHPSIVKLVSRSKVMNPSLSSSVHLQKMLEDRNTAAMTFLNAQGQAAEPKENLFEENEEVEDKQPASKKRKCADAGDFTVEIQVQEQPVQVLLRGARPTRSDLLVRMEPDQLKAVLQLLEEEAADCLAADRRQYKKAKQ